MSDYVKVFEDPRERWIHGYFNWTDEDQITDAERHTARDGFDAGATWMEKQASQIVRDLVEVYKLDLNVLDEQFKEKIGQFIK